MLQTSKCCFLNEKHVFHTSFAILVFFVLQGGDLKAMGGKGEEEKFDSY